jgi:predicted ATPase
MTDARIAPKLKKLVLRGYRSIEEETFEFTTLDVLIGPNGAGKSNLIDFLRMIRFMVSGESGLSSFVARHGGASALLFDGPKRTPQIAADITVETGRGLNEYRFRLGYAADDTLIFLEEACRFSSGQGAPPRWIDFGAGHRSPKLLDVAGVEGKTQKAILALLRGISVFQFHDTSDAAAVKTRSHVDDSRFLRGDAANLAAFLLHMREFDGKYYRRVVETVRQVAPFFEDFDLTEEHGTVLLRWREIGSELLFGTSQISDGTLRAIALITLLLQPPRSMPPVIVVDEPELGLHPFAIATIVGLLRGASIERQCLIATQSPETLNAIDPSAVIVVERNRRASRFRRLSVEELKPWFEEYALSELWDMNILGGRPGARAAE